MTPLAVAEVKGHMEVADILQRKPGTVQRNRKQTLYFTGIFNVHMLPHTTPILWAYQNNYVCAILMDDVRHPSFTSPPTQPVSSHRHISVQSLLYWLCNKRQKQSEYPPLSFLCSLPPSLSRQRQQSPDECSLHGWRHRHVHQSNDQISQEAQEEEFVHWRWSPPILVQPLCQPCSRYR